MRVWGGIRNVYAVAALPTGWDEQALRRGLKEQVDQVRRWNFYVDQFYRVCNCTSDYVRFISSIALILQVRVNSKHSVWPPLVVYDDTCFILTALLDNVAVVVIRRALILR